jgi:hypothetical protein
MFNKGRTAMDEALERQPPSITWRKNNRGVWIATSIQDPHAETSVEAHADRMRAAAEMASREQARLYALEAERQRARMRTQAAEVAERFEQHRANNTSLMQAARTEI